MKNICLLLFIVLLVSCSCKESKNINETALCTDTYVYLGSDNNYHSIESQEPFAVTFSEDLTKDNNLKVIKGGGDVVVLDSLSRGGIFFYDGMYRVHHLSKISAYYDAETQHVVKSSSEKYELRILAWELILIPIVFALVFLIVTRLEDRFTDESYSYEVASLLSGIGSMCIFGMMAGIAIEVMFAVSIPAIVMQVLLVLVIIFMTLAFVFWIASWFIGIKNYYKPFIALIVLSVLSFICHYYFDLSEYLTLYCTIIPATFAMVSVYIYRYLRGTF